MVGQTGVSWTSILNPRSPAVCGRPPQAPRELLALHWDPFGGDELLDQTRLLPLRDFQYSNT